MNLHGKFRLLLQGLLVCLVLFEVTGAWAVDTIDQLKLTAYNYYYGLGVAKDYTKALSLYLQAAETGDAEAQYIAGAMYFRGFGTAVDYDKAFKLLYQAAKNGTSTRQSQKILGESFLLGRGVPTNYAEALRWFRTAAEAGDRDAQNELAYMYFVGRGVQPDPARAYQLFREAAVKGLPMAQYNVGVVLYTGRGVPAVDLPGAYAWFSLAATKGHVQAAAAQRFLESVLSRDELRQAQTQAKALYEIIR